MKLTLTPALQQLLEQASCDQTLPQDVRTAAAAAVGGPSVEWATVKAVARLAAEGAAPVPPLDELCKGSGIAVPEARKRDGMPEELRRRLEQLQARLEQQQYDAMVADVTKGERRAAAAREGGLASYKQQISFGLHVLAMMAAFYAFGHVAGMALTSNRALHPICGLVLMVSAMLLETVLYILRTSVPPKLHAAAAARAVAARVARQQERHKREAAATGAAASSAAAAGAAASSAAAAGGGGSTGSAATVRLPPPGSQEAADGKKDD